MVALPGMLFNFLLFVVVVVVVDHGLKLFAVFCAFRCFSECVPVLRLWGVVVGSNSLV